jgi:tetratricopeptide (TPR) repeat protein
MKELSQKYPDDLDAATLYADSMMNLRPWKLYTADGNPEEGTNEIVAALESVLKRNPDNVGANHLYIHAVEASTHPERAMEAAARLPGLAPAAGHLVHMPSHVYIRTGDYEAASNTNVAAVEVDEDFLKTRPEPGFYAMMYYPHNIHFVAVSRAIEGRSKEATAAAEKLAKQVAPHVAMMPPLEAFCTIPEMVLVKLQRWDEILARPEPDATKMPLTHASWRFARGCALAGKGDVTKAQAERDALAGEIRRIPSESLYGMLNRTRDVFDVADKYLQARIASARKDDAAAIDLLGSAAKAEDKLTYSEPPDWIIPCREALGSALMRAGKFADAEQVFRADLQKNARSGRSLFGLRESLKAQGKTYDAQLVDPQFQNSWKNADVKLNVMDL